MQGRARAIDRPPQHPLPGVVVDVPFLVGGACIPLGEVIREVIRERGRRAAEIASGDVAKGVVAAGVDLPALARAAGAQGGTDLLRGAGMSRASYHCS